jgi:hypothetical protein
MNLTTLALGSWKKLGHKKKEIGWEQTKVRNMPKTLGEWKGSILEILKMNSHFGS